MPGTGSQLESLWMRFVGATVFVVGVLYRPPKSSMALALEDLQLQMTSLLARQHPLYALGDINIDLLQPSSAGAQRYMAMLSDLSLQQLITTPTRTTSTSSKLIDHVITSNAELTSDARVIDCSASDHDMVTVNIQSKRTRRAAQSVTVRSMKNVDNAALWLDLLLADWSSVYSATTASAKWDAWLEVWQPLIDKHLPIRTVRLKHPPCPWLQDNIELQDCMERDGTEHEKPWLETAQVLKPSRFIGTAEMRSRRHSTGLARSTSPSRIETSELQHGPTFAGIC